ncbi:MAG: bifunctional folylpolyglutamate synthase/dihydrofolate synthase [Magnetococcus sp. DMHC-1]
MTTAWGQTAHERLLSQAAQFSAQRIRLGLGRMRRLMNVLGNPERGLYAIHVAGTNGKGSTVAFLEAILHEAGHEPAVYTSPHLQRFHERIRSHGRDIDDATLESLLMTVLRANAGEPATFFELTTAVALLHFSHLQPRSPPPSDTRSRPHADSQSNTRFDHHAHACADAHSDNRAGTRSPVHARPSIPPPAVILETGLGGRLDATNVIHPHLTLITPIGLDHQEYLGETLSRIAREKAGILKPGVPAAADPGSETASASIARRAEHLGITLWLHQRDYRFTQPDDSGMWRYQDALGTLDLPPLRLPGHHQYGNAALALAGLRLLSTVASCPWSVPLAACQKGISQAWLPGRLELVPGTPPVWLDGAHNCAGTRVLAAALADMEPLPTHLVFTALQDKDIPGMADLLAPWVRQVWIAPLSEPRAANPEAMAHIWRQQGIATSICPDPATALRSAQKSCPHPGRVLVTGSLHLVGIVRSLLFAR